MYLMEPSERAAKNKLKEWFYVYKMPATLPDFYIISKKTGQSGFIEIKYRRKSFKSPLTLLNKIQKDFYKIKKFDILYKISTGRWFPSSFHRSPLKKELHEHFGVPKQATKRKNC